MLNSIEARVHHRKPRHGSKDGYWEGHHDQFIQTLVSLEKRAEEGTRLPALFDELKELQRSYREIKLTREHRSKIWERLDATFKVVKEKRFGPNANNESSALDRLNRRYKGLMGAIEKMQKSIARDEHDLSFQQRKKELLPSYIHKCLSHEGTFSLTIT